MKIDKHIAALRMRVDVEEEPTRTTLIGFLQVLDDLAADVEQLKRPGAREERGWVKSVQSQ